MNFHKDELVWRDEKHQHDQAMTWLTSIESDDEFDRMVMLVRFARAFGGEKTSSLNHWETRRLRILIDKGFVRGFFAVFSLLDRFVGVRKKLRRSVGPVRKRRADRFVGVRKKLLRILKHRIAGRPDRPTHDQYSFK